MNKKTLLLCVSVGLLAAGSFGYYLIVTPTNPLVRFFRSPKVALAETTVSYGPYPTADDFVQLKKDRVQVVISLLNPAIPYEAQLFAEEQKNAADYGMELYNFPMSSILGQTFGNDYEKNARAAATLINSLDQRVYIHCYLGVHRVAHVIELARAESDKKVFTLHAHTKWSDQTFEPTFQKALQQYKIGDYAGVIALIPEQPDLNTSSKNLLGWSHYQIGHTEIAQRIFSEIIAVDPTNNGAHSGYGYAALRLGSLDDAMLHFNKAVEIDQNDAESLAGLGIGFFRRQQFGDARTYLHKALIINPQNLEATDLLKKIPQVTS